MVGYLSTKKGAFKTLIFVLLLDRPACKDRVGLKKDRSGTRGKQRPRINMKVLLEIKILKGPLPRLY